MGKPPINWGFIMDNSDLPPLDQPGRQGSVSVGRQGAWNNLCMIASCSALALVVFDLLFHLQYSIQGTLLQLADEYGAVGCGLYLKYPKMMVRPNPSTITYF